MQTQSTHHPVTISSHRISTHTYVQMDLPVQDELMLVVKETD